jgi:hypothetical protein
MDDNSKVPVSIGPLRQVLAALTGPSYLIRELQVTRGPGFDDNPIDQLIKEFNEHIKAIKAEQEQKQEA